MSITVTLDLDERMEREVRDIVEFYRCHTLEEMISAWICSGVDTFYEEDYPGGADLPAFEWRRKIERNERGNQ